MKALIKKPHSKATLEDAHIPSLKENSVLIKVLIAGICRTDIYAAQGKIPLKDKIILGHEFCGIIEKSRSSKFNKGDLVTINPLSRHGFLGLDFNGAFAEYCVVPAGQIYKLPSDTNTKLAAYMEPIAASLAPIKALNETDKNKKIAIYGKNRIALLTKKILECHGFSCELFYKDIIKNNFDIIIETEQSEEALHNISESLKPQGLLILKSRNPKNIPFNFYNLVKKEISIKSTYYQEFSKAIEFALNNQDIFTKIFGDAFNLEDWEIAFENDKKGDKKYFFKIGEK